MEADAGQGVEMTDRHECELGDDCGNGGPACVELDGIAYLRKARDRTHAKYLRELASREVKVWTDEMLADQRSVAEIMKDMGDRLYGTRA